MGFMPYGIGLLVLVLLVMTIMDGAHIYTWMDAETVAHDSIIKSKSSYLNKTFFWIRTVIYLAVYAMYWNGYRKRSIAEDEIGGTEIHFKNYKKLRFS